MCPQGLTIGGEDNPVGMVTDTMMTVCDILGVMPEVQSAGMVHPRDRQPLQTASDDRALSPPPPPSEWP